MRKTIPKNMKRTNKTLSTYKTAHSSDAKKSNDTQEIYLSNYNIKQIGEWIIIRKHNDGQKPSNIQATLVTHVRKDTCV